MKITAKKSDGLVNSTIKTELPAPVSKKPVDVDIEIEAHADPLITDDQALAAFRENGLVDVQPGTVKNLANLGIYTKSVGSLKIQRGRVLVSQHRLDKVMNALVNEFDRINSSDSKAKKTEKLLGLAKAIGQLTARQTECQELAIDIESKAVAAGAPVQDGPQPTQASFPQRAKIQPTTMIHAQHVTIHEGKPVKT